jgi:hypothetical protein
MTDKTDLRSLPTKTKTEILHGGILAVLRMTIPSAPENSTMAIAGYLHEEASSEISRSSGASG